jgi:LysR family transcriptional regulator for bpeEF and oprC
MRDLNTVVIFVKVAEYKNMTHAARQLGLTASAVSKTITKLESELNVTLFVRSTRAVYLTNDGAIFHERCKSILSQLDDAETSLKASQTNLRGHVRVQMPVGLGRRIVVPALPRFRARYPEIILDVELSNRIVDLGFERIDVCVMWGVVSDEQVIARKVCDVRRVACASPHYLSRFGEPQTPDDLDRHNCLAYVVPQTGSYREWHFSHQGKTFTKQVSGTLNFNHGESLLEAAVAGEGIAMLGTYLTDQAVKSGKLKVILRDWVAQGPQVSVAYLPNRNQSPRVRAFIDFLLQECRESMSYESAVARAA